MLRKFLIATALLTASGTALAGQAYVHGSVVSVDPSFAVSYGSGPYNSGFSVMVSSGGAPYWGTPYRYGYGYGYGYGPAPVIVVPPPRYRVYAVPPGHAYKHGYGHGRGHGGKGDHYRYDRRGSDHYGRRYDRH